MDRTPASLLERLRGPAAQRDWERFVELYTPLLYHWARRTGLPEPDVADLVQDVFLALLLKLPDFTYDRRRSFRAWLKTVTLNKLHKHIYDQQAMRGNAGNCRTERERFRALVQWGGIWSSCSWGERPISAIIEAR